MLIQFPISILFSYSLFLTHIVTLDEFKKSTCYITQDDRLQLLLTVYENMKTAADFKLGNSVSVADKNKRVSSYFDKNMTCFV
jgi:ABC-type multidrug transport system ATPase subunit